MVFKGPARRIAAQGFITWCVQLVWCIVYSVITYHRLEPKKISDAIVVLTSVVFWIVIAVLVFWALGAYNRLVGLRAQVLRALQGLTVQWQSNAKDRKSTRLNSSHPSISRMPSSA